MFYINKINAMCNQLIGHKTYLLTVMISQKIQKSKNPKKLKI
jgi:hypothetical protein